MGLIPPVLVSLRLVAANTHESSAPASPASETAASAGPSGSPTSPGRINDERGGRPPLGDAGAPAPHLRLPLPNLANAASYAPLAEEAVVPTPHAVDTNAARPRVEAPATPLSAGMRLNLSAAAKSAEINFGPAPRVDGLGGGWQATVQRQAAAGDIFVRAGALHEGIVSQPGTDRAAIDVTVLGGGGGWAHRVRGSLGPLELGGGQEADVIGAVRYAYRAAGDAQALGAEMRVSQSVYAAASAHADFGPALNVDFSYRVRGEAGIKAEHKAEGKGKDDAPPKPITERELLVSRALLSVRHRSFMTARLSAGVTVPYVPETPSPVERTHDLNLTLALNDNAASVSANFSGETAGGQTTLVKRVDLAVGIGAADVRVDATTTIGDGPPPIGLSFKLRR